MIYALQPLDGGPIKLGCTNNVDRRIKQLEAHYGRPLALLATMPGGRDEERAIHERFAHLRLGRTEQFQAAPDLMAFIGRPLLACANPETIEVMIPEQGVTIIQMKGSPAYASWLEAIHRRTLIPKTAIIRWAMAEWAKKHGHEEPPEI